MIPDDCPHTAEIARLEAIQKGRALTTAECVALDRLLFNQWQRRHRAPGQIERLRGQVDRIAARLSPADQLRELRAEARRAWERLRECEDALDPDARLRRVERELVCSQMEGR